MLMNDIYVAGNHEIETASGIFIDLFDPDPADINLEDIAHGLSNTCRFSGHCDRFYSVAEHACLVMWRLEKEGFPPETLRKVLHHDDSEAYLTDIPRPLKPLLGESYKALTNLMDAAIWSALELGDWTDAEYKAMKIADNWALAVEAKKMLPSRGRGWVTEGLDAEFEHNFDLGRDPEEAKEYFLVEDQRIRDRL